MTIMTTTAPGLVRTVTASSLTPSEKLTFSIEPVDVLKSSTPTGPLADSYLDTIEQLSAPLARMSDLDSLVTLLAMAYQLRHPSPITTPHLDTLMRILTAGKLDPILDNQLQQPSADDLNIKVDSEVAEANPPADKDVIIASFARFLSPVLNGLAGLSELENRISAFSDPVGFRQFWAFDGRNFLSEAIGSSGDLLVARGREPSPEVQVPFVEAYVDDGSLQVALTREKGMLALVPGETQVGDELWLVPGKERAEIRRQGDDQGWTTVGDAFLRPSR